MSDFRNTPSRRAALYLRCSTERGHTDNQRLAVMQIAAARGLTVVEVFEENISSVKERPEWQRLRAAAHRGEFDAVLVFALDRLGRSLVGNLQEVLALDRLGIQVISVREPWLDMAGPIASRCRAGQERARREGKHVGRPRAVVDLGRAVELRIEGLSIRKAAVKLGLSPSVLHRALRGVPEVPLGDASSMA